MQQLKLKLFTIITFAFYILMFHIYFSISSQPDCSQDLRNTAVYFVRIPHFCGFECSYVDLLQKLF